MKWQTNGTCGPNLLCDTSPGINQGTCQPILQVCNGAMPGDKFCDKNDVVECGPDLVTINVVQSCQFGCQAGMCLFGDCMPGQTECVGNQMRTCSMSGQWEAPQTCPVDMPVCAGGACAEPRSCMGLPKTCGPMGNESCCASPIVPGGTYNRINNPAYPATVSEVRLDRFEVTVGRFRKFYNVYGQAKPMAGAGVQPKISNSGWDPLWDVNLPNNQGGLASKLGCSGTTWTSGVGANENKPITCVDWYLMFAFCAWDGGFLPTEAQWNNAAAGGNEQRLYPWGNTMPDATLALFECNGDGMSGCVAGDLLQAGSRSPKGDGRWGQADLGGSMYEWLLDKNISNYGNQNCVDCADIVSGASRVIRGGDWMVAGTSLSNTVRNYAGPTFSQNNIGGRCARIP